MTEHIDTPTPGSYTEMCESRERVLRGCKSDLAAIRAELAQVRAILGCDEGDTTIEVAEYVVECAGGNGRIAQALMEAGD